jgi:hypothetical protein
LYLEPEVTASIEAVATQTETKEMPYLRPSKKAVRVENYGGVKILSY